jgi:hypothetical protein
MANAFTIQKRDLAGTERVHTVLGVLDTYTDAGVAVTLGQLGLKKLNSMTVQVVGDGSTALGETLVATAEWDGSKTAPKIGLYDGTFAELADGAITVRVLIVARGA